LSVVSGPRDGRCLAVVPVAGERTRCVLAVLHQVMQQRGEQPALVQTDRAPCFVGAEGGERKALPGRLTLWLWGLGISHRVLPPAKPWRNGAVERFHGAVEHSWAGEPEGIAALQAVWNHGKHHPAPAVPYQDRSGFSLERVWQGLAQVRVKRSVDAQGKLSVWDRPLRVGRAWAYRTVVVTFDLASRLVVVRTPQGDLLREVPLPWLTAAWLWAGIEGADHPCEHDGTSTFG
jgi:hypothetical protein